jgi:hypothetical protein
MHPYKLKRKKMKKEISDFVFETSIKEIEKLISLSMADIQKNPLILKLSQTKNNHILSILKQQEINYKLKDLELRITMYDLRENAIK